MAVAAAAVDAVVACHIVVAFVDDSLVVVSHNLDDNQLELDHCYQL